MRVFALIAPLILIPLPISAQTEVLRTTYLGHEIALMDDGTWRFLDDSVSLGDAEAADDGCMATMQGDIRFCPDLQVWRRTVILVEEGDETRYLEADGGAPTLVVTHYADAGHDGDAASYADPDMGLSTGDKIMLKLFEATSGVDIPEETASVFGDVVAIETYTEADDWGFASYTLELMSTDDSLYIHLADTDLDGTEGGMTDAFDEMAHALRADIEVEGRSLAQLAGERTE